MSPDKILRAVFLACLWLLATGSACEPQDQPGGELTEILISLQGKNPGADGRYTLQVDERARILALGRYLSGREEEIALALFWQLSPPGPAELICESDELTGDRLMVIGRQPGQQEIRGVTRNEADTVIPCSPAPDGGWSFPDAGNDWPLWSHPMQIEIRGGE